MWRGATLIRSPREKLRRAAACLAFLAALGAGGRAAAAEDPDRDFSLDDTVQAGPLHVAPFFVIKDFGYDDNVRLDAEEASGDYTLTLGPGARGVIPLGRLAAFAFREEIDYALFARESDLNHVNNDFTAKLHVYLRELTLFADGRQQSLRERPNTEVDYRIRNTVTQEKLGVSWRPFQRGQVDLYARGTAYRYDAGRPESQDEFDEERAAQTGQGQADLLRRDELAVGVDGRLRLLPRASVLLDLQGGGIDFTHRAGAERDSTFRKAMAGMQFDPAGSLRGHLKVGRKHLSPRDAGVDGYSGWVADSSLSLRLFGRGEARATWERDTSFSVLGENLFAVLHTRGLAYEHYFSSRVSVELGRRATGVSYPERLPDLDDCTTTGTNPPVTVCDERLRRDDITSDTLTFRYRVGSSLRVGLSVGRWERDSTSDPYDTRRLTLATVLEYTP